MARIFKIYCRECNSPAVIARSERLHPDLYSLYCVCKNPECGHTWKAEYVYNHSLRSTKLDRDALVNYLISKLPRTELQQLSENINKQLGLELK
ncbi:ogr/Delta-like zinc finger family protein [Pasteurella multocida]|nr:ogr/Delta-like zinc finger family protein [Pasteurella multocida]HDR1874070.1 ogr/Delta-like zinc finger family protein [Pasteurella multocida]HDR1894430.1 ogr/Delta-like zinc finger family protein [Pasteurella multocida]HED4406673.1 ogr/Delta-like zinc finger family protein [Pasteurella multocida]